MERMFGQNKLLSGFQIFTAYIFFRLLNISGCHQVCMRLYLWNYIMQLPLN